MEIMKRLIAALSILAPLGIYVYGIQVTYDKVDIAKEPGLRAFLFLVALLAGSATYDFAKRALLMPTKHFDRFFKGLLGAWCAFVCILLSAALSAVILNYPGWRMVPSWVGHLSFIFSLVFTAWFVIDLTRAIEAATKDK